MCLLTPVIDDHVSYMRNRYGLRDWNLWEWGPFAYRFPLWILFLAAAIPTNIVRRFVPKFPRGHCRRCGYTLKGLTEATCPECGAQVERAIFEPPQRTPKEFRAFLR